MSRLRTRMLTGGTAMLVAAAVALPVTAPAFADPGGPTFDVVTSKSTADVGDFNVYFLVQMAGLGSSCIESRPTVDYTLTVTAPGGAVSASSGTLDDEDLYNGGSFSTYWDLWLPLEGFQAGEVYEFSAFTDHPCFGDGLTFEDSATITINGGGSSEEPGNGGDWPYEGEDTVAGTVYVQTVAGSTSADDYELGAGVEVSLVPVDGDWHVVDSMITQPDGAFTLTAPIEEPGDEELEYVIIASVGEDTYVYAADASPSNPSPDDGFEDATFLAPIVFDNGTSYDIYAGTVPRVAHTVFDKICSWDGSEYEEVETSTVFWEDLCLTDGSISDAELAHLDDAFDDFGNIAFPSDPDGAPTAGDYDDDYFVTADEYTFSTTPNGAVLSFVDEDVFAYDSEGVIQLVDVFVRVELFDQWAQWTVHVYLADRADLAHDVPFYFVGDLGSDEDTEWHSQDGDLLSWDGGNGDALIGHRMSGMLGGVYAEDGDDRIRVRAQGTLTYELALMDWCSGDAPQAGALDAFTTTALGGAIPVLGDECPPHPAWEFPVPSFTAGTPYDVTIHAPTDAPWNWAYGGSVYLWDLPEGLEWHPVDSWEEDAAPGVRVYGTPVEPGEYTFGVYLEDDYGHDVEFDVSGTIAPAGSGHGGDDDEGEDDGDGDPFPEERDLELELDLELGQQVEGSQATATASGLEEGADYDLIVRSTPVTVGVGTVPVGGTVVRTVTLPALEAGWHSLTFTSTWAGGGAAVAKVWFQVSATGTLLAISYQEPNLAYTGGGDVSGSVLLASLAILGGLGLVVVRRRTAKA